MKHKPSAIHSKPWYLSGTLHWVFSSWLVTIALTIVDIVQNGGITAKICAFFFWKVQPFIKQL